LFFSILIVSLSCTAVTKPHLTASRRARKKAIASSDDSRFLIVSSNEVVILKFTTSRKLSIASCKSVSLYQCA